MILGDARRWAFQLLARAHTARDRRRDIVDRSYLAAIIASSEDAIVGMTLDGMVMSWNAGATRLYGYTAKEMIGSPISCTIPPDRLEELPGLLKRLGVGDTIQHLETTRLRKDGQFITVALSLSPIYDETSTCIGAATIARDVSENKRAEQALRASEEGYRLLFERNPLPSWVYEEHTRCILAVNQAAIQHYGYSRDEFLDLHIDDLRPPEDLSALCASLEVAEDGVRRVATTRHYTRGGSRIDVEMVSHPLDFDGRTARLVVVRDVTERLQAELVLHASMAQQLLQATALEASANAIVITDGSGVIEFVNPAFSQLTGYTFAEATGQTLRLLKSGAQNPALYEDLWETVLAGRAWQGELVNRRKDGTTYTEATTITPVRNQDGTVGHFIAVKEDVTARNAAEATLSFQAKLLGAVQHAVIATDLDGRITYWNPMAETLYGWASTEVHGKLVREFVVPEHAREQGVSIMAAVRQGASWSGEFQVRRRDGSCFPVDVTNAPIFGADGQMTGIIGVSTDISARKHAEEGRRASDERLGTVLANAPVVLFAVDADGIFTLAVGKSFDALGFPAAELVGRSMFEMAAAIPAIEANIRRVLAGEAFTASVDVGAWLFETHYEPILADDGRIVGATGVATDVTERGHVEEALRLSRQELLMLLEHTPEVIKRFNRDCQHLYVNPVVERMTGIPAAAHIGKTHRELGYALDVAERMEAAINSVFTTGQPTEIEFAAEYDGERTWKHALFVPELDAAGHVKTVLSVTREITARKEAELALTYQALHDSLTGLPNRVLLRDRLDQGLLESQRLGTSLSLIVVDLDRFKEVNDTLGHQMGDALLRVIAGRFRDRLRASDTVARLGGDEFAVLLMGASGDEAVGLIQDLHSCLEQPVELGNQTVTVSASMGIAAYPEHGGDADALLRRADIAMYAAKGTGEGWALYAPEHEQHSTDHLTLLSELRQAIEQNQLVGHAVYGRTWSSGRIL